MQTIDALLKVLFVEEAVDHLPDDVQTLKAMLIAAQRREAHLQHIIRMLQRNQFGQRSEKLPPDQLALGLEDQAIAMAEAETLVADGEAARDGRKRGRPRREGDEARASLPPHLLRIEVVIPPQATACACCGGTLHQIGEDRAERLDVIPAQFRVLVTVRPKMGCRACGDGVARAPAPARLVPGGLPTEGLVAHILTSKYADHLPLYRQQQIMARAGIEIERSVMAGWVGHAAARLKPLVERMQARMLTADRLFADETTVKVLAPGKGSTKTGYFWAMARDDRAHGGQDPPWVVYRYYPGRAHKYGAELLAGYRGILQVDGYDAYDALGDPRRPGGPATLAHCWAHVRRKLFDVAKGGNAPIAEHMLGLIQRMYQHEKEVRGQSPAVRLARRQADSRPIIDQMHAYIETTLAKALRCSDTAKALRYARSRWATLTRFLEDGRIELDTNSIERCMRPIALQRKNALFAGHDLGAENWAAIASLIESAKLCGHDPQAYLKDILTRLLERSDADPIDDLLPGYWIDTKAAESRFEISSVPHAA